MFHKLAKARLVLSDPARRTKYDQTGEVDAEADSRAQNVLSALAQALDAALQIVAQGAADAGAINILDHMRTDIGAKIEQGNQARSDYAALLARIEQVKGRFSIAADKPNQIEAILVGRLNDLRRALAKADDQREILQTALDTLKAYSYRVDDNAGMMFYPLGQGVFNQSSTSTTGW